MALALISDSRPPRPRFSLSWIFLSPGAERLRAGWRLLAHLVLMTICFIIFGAILGVLLGLDFISRFQLVYEEVTAALAVTLSVFLARRFLDRRSFASLGLTVSWQSLIDLAFGILLPGLLMGLIFAIEWALGWLKLDNSGGSLPSTGQLLGQAVGAFIFFIVVGWQEELLSRGYWLQNLTDGLNLTWGVLISSLIFALAHFQNPNVSWVAVLGLVCDGLFLAFGYLRTRRLWLPVGLHIGWNFFEGVVYGFPVSGLGNLFQLTHPVVKGPELFTGGAFGPEAGLIQLPVLVLGVIIMAWYTSRRKG